MTSKKITKIVDTDEIRISAKLTAKGDPEIYLWLVSHKNNDVMESKLFKDALKKLILSGEFPVSDLIYEVELPRVLKLHLNDLKSQGLVTNTNAIDIRLRANPRKIAVTNKNQEDRATERHKLLGPHPTVAPNQTKNSANPLADQIDTKRMEPAQEQSENLPLMENERQLVQAVASPPLQPPSHGGKQVADNEAKEETYPSGEMDILDILDSFAKVSP